MNSQFCLGVLLALSSLTATATAAKLTTGGIPAKESNVPQPVPAAGANGTAVIPAEESSDDSEASAIEADYDFFGIVASSRNWTA